MTLVEMTCWLALALGAFLGSVIGVLLGLGWWTLGTTATGVVVGYLSGIGIALLAERRQQRAWQKETRRDQAEGGSGITEYDEDTVLTDYIWFNYTHLMSRAELFGHKASAGGDQELSAIYEQEFGQENWRQMVEAYSKGPEAFRRRVRDRLLVDHASLIEITRCPSCQRIVKTPVARQCLWCGFDWHGTD